MRRELVVTLTVKNLDATGGLVASASKAARLRRARRSRKSGHTCSLTAALSPNSGVNSNGLRDIGRSNGFAVLRNYGAITGEAAVFARNCTLGRKPGPSAISDVIGRITRVRFPNGTRSNLLNSSSRFHCTLIIRL